jgi:D-3-phosphoglycerate dehydrogenase
MKILIADSFPESHSSQLAGDGHDVTVNPSLDGSSLVEAMDSNEILVVRSTKVSADVLEAGSDLKLVIRAGAGTNTIDKNYAADIGIKVCNVPGANAIAVAELVMGLIIAIDRNIPENALDLKSNIWNKKKYSTARGLYGRKIGILGLGAIGFAVAERANAFGIKVYAVAKSGRSKEAERRISEAGITQLDTMDDILATCDIITLHLPATDDTKGMVNKSFLGKMQPGSVLINSSRGELIDEAALIKAMDEKGIRAGLDVYDNEPGAGDVSFDSLLACHPAVCGTHHIGASTDQAQIAVADGVIRVIQSYEEGKLRNCVN